MTFARRIPDANNPRLILEAPTKVARRELLLAAKKTNRAITVLLHLSPQSQANKSYIYYKARQQQLRINDRGDIVIVYQESNTQQNAKIDVQSGAQTVTDKMEYFLEEQAQAHRRS